MNQIYHYDIVFCFVLPLLFSFLALHVECQLQLWLMFSDILDGLF